MATKLRKLGRWGGPSPRQVGAFAFLAFLGLEIWPESGGGRAGGYTWGIKK